MRLKNKLAVITAAASGMGRAGCEVFAREGATVFAIDIDQKRLDDVVASVEKAGGKAFGLVADLLDPAVCRDAIEKAAAPPELQPIMALPQGFEVNAIFG